MKLNINPGHWVILMWCVSVGASIVTMDHGYGMLIVVWTVVVRREWVYRTSLYSPFNIAAKLTLLQKLKYVSHPLKKYFTVVLVCIFRILVKWSLSIPRILMALLTFFGQSNARCWGTPVLHLGIYRSYIFLYLFLEL